MNLVFILIATITISLVSLIGVLFLKMKEEKLQQVIYILVSFATGALIGGALLHLLPEAIEISNYALIHTIIGIFTFFILEKILYWRHCHKGHCEVHIFTYLNLIGDGIHNVIDGLIIGSSFTVNPELGITTSLAILLHEIPQEMGDFGILIYGGFKKNQALLFNLLSGLSCVVGGIIAYIAASSIEAIKIFLLGFTAGGFLYIAMVDILPELRIQINLRQSLVQILLIVFGIGLMWGIKGLLH